MTLLKAKVAEQNKLHKEYKDLFDKYKKAKLTKEIAKKIENSRWELWVSVQAMYKLYNTTTPKISTLKKYIIILKENYE